MDKQQNELTKSYLRARKNTLEHVVDNIDGFYNTKLKQYEITEKTIYVFKDYLSKIDEYEIKYILYFKPQLKKYFE